METNILHNHTFKHTHTYTHMNPCMNACTDTHAYTNTAHRNPHQTHAQTLTPHTPIQMSTHTHTKTHKHTVTNYWPESAWWDPVPAEWTALHGLLWACSLLLSPQHICPRFPHWLEAMAEPEKRKKKGWAVQKISSRPNMDTQTDRQTDKDRWQTNTVTPR